jgi:hypothetical protein
MIMGYVHGNTQPSKPIQRLSNENSEIIYVRALVVKLI